MRSILVCIAVGGLMLSCKPSGDAGGKAGGQRGSGGPAFPVDVAIVESRLTDYEVKAPGELAAFESVQVTSRVAGTVDRVAFTEGQEVTKDAVLVVIDSERYRLAVSSAQANYDKALASQADAEAMAARRAAVGEAHPGLIPGEEVASYKTRTLMAKADAAVARESLRGAQLNLRDASVRAPIAGVIQTRTVETGQYVQPGYVMATLLRNDPMLLRFSVTPQDAPRIKPDMVAEFSLRESRRSYTARVTLVSGAADADTHMISVTAEVHDDEHQYWLRPGSFCDVVIRLPANRPAPIIPRSAVRASERGLIAYVVEGDVAHERVIELGMTTSDGSVEVRSGLVGGERLVIAGGEPLSEGAKVRVSGQGGGPRGAGSAEAATAAPAAAPAASATATATADATEAAYSSATAAAGAAPAPTSRPSGARKRP